MNIVFSLSEYDEKNSQITTIEAKIVAKIEETEEKAKQSF